VFEASVFLVFSVFFLLYGLTPILGGDGLGLVGADEPRYAQIAHEMLARFDSARSLEEGVSACPAPHQINCILQAIEGTLKERLSA